MRIKPRVLVQAVLALAVGLHAGTSKLWGANGELWDPLGRLPDFSYAGYHAGGKPIPSLPVVANVKTFGCIGDGKADDSPCLQSAIDATGPGALLLPKGRYRLTRQILIHKNGLVLRGEGSGADGTVLVWSKGLQELTGNIYPSNWGAGGLMRFGPGPAGSGTGATPKTNANSPLAKTADHPPASDAALGDLVATVTAPGKRGDNFLPLSSTAGIASGGFIVLTLTDPANLSLNAYLHNDQGSNDYNQDMPLRWVVKVRSVDENRIGLAQPLRFDVRSEWQPKINLYHPVEESGLEDMRFEFPDVAYAGHQLEPGFNAFSFTGALNCWARNITLKNCDNGPSLEELTKNCSVLDLTQLPRTNLVINGRISGHHGFSFNINSHDNLLSGFDFQAAFIHGVSVGYNASGNVTRSGRGVDLNLDHHSRSPFENLYSDLDLGLGAYPYLPVVGAGGNELRSGARGTVWNVRTAQGPVPPPPFAFVQYNVIGTTEDKRTADREWLEKIADLAPKDLYLSQLEKRSPTTSVRKSPLRPVSAPGEEIDFDLTGRTLRPGPASGNRRVSRTAGGNGSEVLNRHKKRGQVSIASSPPRP